MKLKRKRLSIRSERGAVQVIEAALIFPVVFLVIFFLIFTANYIMQGVMVYNYAQQAAVAAARELAMPGYGELYGSGWITTQTDFQSPVLNIDQLMKHHEPYRYWNLAGGGEKMLSESRKSKMQSELAALLRRVSFMGSPSVTCTITPSNNVLHQSVNVHVTNQITKWSFLRFIGFSGQADINVNVTAVASDPAEFIRNVDMVDDYLEQTGVKSKITDTITKFKDQIKGILDKFKLG